ncbi:MAG: CAP domain-containing protein [Proteobacteria bacterium]|nr:CAP domain-containing protein [Pseudomonadota bacterium]MDE3208608.1 CAP domain-containing protein [Pseudomonadota bacterium]
MKNQVLGLLVLGMLITPLPGKATQNIKNNKEGSTHEKIQNKDKFIYTLFRDINEFRRTHGLKPLYYSRLYTEIAEDHSQDMALRHSLDHKGFKRRFVLAQSYHCVENIAWNYPTPAQLLSGWKHSPLHRKNMLDSNLSAAGIGMSSAYVTFFACK